jgi:hypothetical protein
MLALLVWLAGCVLGVWYILHAGYGHLAVAYALCTAVTIWILGGANWIGQKLGNAVARRTEPPSAPPYTTGLRSDEQERDLLRKAAAQHQRTREG